MKKLNFLIILFLFIFNIKANATVIEGYNYNNPDSYQTHKLGVIPPSDTEKRVASMPVYLTGQTSDTTKLIIQPRIFDNQEFEYINNATATDSVVIAINKTGELKVFENELYNITIVRFGLDVSPIPAGEDSPGLLGKIKSITYTKP